jgi:hypothetical protein
MRCQNRNQAQEERCAYCEREFACLVDGKIEFLRAEVDHFIAQSAGGRTTEPNILSV